MNNALNLSSGPHIRDKWTTPYIMHVVSLSLMPATIVGVCVLRVIWILTLFPLNPTLTMLYVSYPISWGVTFLTHLVCYMRVKRKKYGV